MGLMQQFSQYNQPNQLGQSMAMLRSLMQGDTSAAVENLAKSNPQFAQFLSQRNNMTVEQAFKSYGYDLNQIMGIINNS